MSKIYVTGLGPGAKDQMTIRAKNVLEHCPVIIGYTVYIDLIREQFPDKQYLSTPMRKEADRCRMAFEEAEKGQDVAMVCSGDAGVTIRGMGGLMVRFAHCCNPVPGDDIVGFVSRGRGVIVHRKDCPNLKDYDPDRIQPAQWTAETGSEFIVGLRVVADNCDGIVAFVTAEISAMRLSLQQIVGRLDKNKQTVVDISVRLNKRSDLDLLINHIKRDKRIIDVYRTSN